MKTDTSVLIISCDKYSDLWEPFFTLFWRYWKASSFKVYLGSNYLIYSDPRVETIAIGADKNWSHGLLEIVKRIDTPFIILMLEDFFLRETVKINDIFMCVEALRNLNGNMLRLVPYPRPDKSVKGYPFLGYIKPTSPYRVSTQGTLWRKSALLSIIRDGESIWKFELNGTERSRSDNGYYCVWKPILTYGHHVIERGKWFRSEARRFAAMDIGCDFNRRSIMSVRESFIWHIKKLVSYPQNLVPWLLRQKIKNQIKNQILGTK